MQRLLKDHLVEHQDGETVFFTRTCTVCGAVWHSSARRGMNRELAAAEVISAEGRFAANALRMWRALRFAFRAPPGCERGWMWYETN